MGDILPFNPMPVQQLRERYSRAVRDVFNFKTDAIDEMPVNPENVFDTEQGIRGVIRRVSFDGHKPVIMAMFGGVPGVKVPDWTMEQFIWNISCLAFDITGKLVMQEFETNRNTILITYEDN